MSIVTLRTKETWRCGCGWITHGPAKFCQVELSTHRSWTKCPERMESHRSFVFVTIDEHRDVGQLHAARRRLAGADPVITRAVAQWPS